MGVKDNVFGKSLNSLDICEAGSLICETASLINPDNLICKSGSLIEWLELLILETKASHDGLYDEKFNISKQLLFMNIINQEKLDSFVLNYGKEIMVEKKTTTRHN